MTDRDLTGDAGRIVVCGPEYVSLATKLLQRMRLAVPAGGIWEAADIQWWWRQERATDAGGQVFWLDGQGEPAAAVVLTEFGRTVQCDVLVLAGPAGYRAMVWQEAIRRADSAGAVAEFPVWPDDAAGIASLTAAGYRPDDGPGVISSWLDAGSRPKIAPLPAGYTLVSRAEARDQPHPMAARNGAAIEARLRMCSLYRPELDLAVRAPDGSVAGYGLFWADEVTGVGLVEPMRTEQAHERRGIASHLLAAGLDRLAARGCRRLKVSNDIPLYLRAGFVPSRAATAPVYSRKD